jgi:hypothetical protein
MYGLIPSLEPFYRVFERLCGSSGTWTGDIFAIRKAFRQVGVPLRDGTVATNRLNSLYRRGMLTYTTEKRSHKVTIWTVTIVREEKNATRTSSTVHAPASASGTR